MHHCSEVHLLPVRREERRRAFLTARFIREVEALLANTFGSDTLNCTVFESDMFVLLNSLIAKSPDF